MISTKFGLIFFLIIICLGWFACNQKSTIQDIKPGSVFFYPEIEASDSLLFSDIRTLPEIHINYMFDFTYYKPVLDSIDSSAYIQKFLRLQPYIYDIRYTNLIKLNSQYYQSFRGSFHNMDTINQNHWQSILDSTGFRSAKDSIHYRRVFVSVPKGRELEYAAKLNALPSVRNANPVLEAKTN